MYTHLWYASNPPMFATTPRPPPSRWNVLRVCSRGPYGATSCSVAGIHGDAQLPCRLHTKFELDWSYTTQEYQLQNLLTMR